MSTDTAPNTRAPLSRLNARILPTVYTPWVRSMAYALVLANIVLIISGGVVRLTGSGLGCDTWPRCTSTGSWTTTPEMGIHGIVEFGNRLLTFVLMVVTVLAFLSILRIALPRLTGPRQLFPKLFIGVRPEESRYYDLFNLTLLLLWGIPLQAVVGGISVWMKLNPWMITAHFCLSAIMITLAAIYLNRILRYFNRPTQQAEDITAEQLPPRATAMRVLGWVAALLVIFLVLMGTITTGTGPHAGDPQAHRHAFDPWLVTRLHSFSVWGFCLVALTLYILAKKYAWPATFTTLLRYIFALLTYQAIVGYTQFFNGLPIWLVELHLIGSGFFIWAASSLIEKQLTLSHSGARARARGLSLEGHES